MEVSISLVYGKCDIRGINEFIRTWHTKPIALFTPEVFNGQYMIGPIIAEDTIPENKKVIIDLYNNSLRTEFGSERIINPTCTTCAQL